MAATNLEQRVAALERELAGLKSRLSRLPPAKDWRSVVGMFSDDDVVMKRMDAAVLAIREKERQRARRQATRQRQAKV